MHTCILLYTMYDCIPLHAPVDQEVHSALWCPVTPIQGGLPTGPRVACTVGMTYGTEEREHYHSACTTHQREQEDDDSVLCISGGGV